MTSLIMNVIQKGNIFDNVQDGGVAQMVERSLSMREVPGSIPGASTNIFETLSG